MSQMGFIHKWLTEYLPKKDRCSASLKSAEIENHTVNLTDMQGCFLVLVAGKFVHLFQSTHLISRKLNLFIARHNCFRHYMDMRVHT